MRTALGLSTEVAFVTCTHVLAGSFGDPTRECRCTGAIIHTLSRQAERAAARPYRLHIDVPAVPYQELRGKDGGVLFRQASANGCALREPAADTRATITLTFRRVSCANFASWTRRGERTLENGSAAHGPERARATIAF